jgi:hypothetical protein
MKFRVVAKMEQELKQELADHLGGKLVEYNSSIALVRERNPLRIDFEGDENDNDVWIFSVRCNLDRAQKPLGDTGSRPHVLGLPETSIRKETEKDRKGRRFGLKRQIRTADPDFDKQVFVESNAPDEHLKVILTEENRRIVMTLLEHQIQSVEMKQAGVLVIDLRTHIQSVESVSQLAKQLDWLINETLSLKASLPLFVGEKTPHHRLPRVKWTYLFLMAFLVLGVIVGVVTGGLEMHPVEVDFPPPVLKLLFAGLVAAVLFVPLAFLIARGHTRGVGHFYGLVILGFISIPFGTFMWGVATNCLLDKCPPQTHDVVVVKTPEICSSRSPKRESVLVQDWRDKRRSFKLNLHDSRLCDASKRGDHFLLTVKKGFWGWPWLRRFQRVQ